MNIPSLPLIDNCIFIDNSMIELLNTCPRALEYNRLHKRILAAESPSLNFGSAIHLALEHRYKTCANLPASPFDEAEIASILTDFFEEKPAPVGDFRTLNWALEVVKKYNLIYGQEDFNLLEYEQPQTCSHCNGVGSTFDKENQTRPCFFCRETGKNKLMVELPFALPLFAILLPSLLVRIDWDGDPKTLRPGEVGVFYSGRIDLPNLKEDNQVFVMDHKTTSLLGPTFFDDKKMSAQQKGYAWSFQKLTGMPVRGYEVNAIRIKEPPQWITNGGEPKRGGRKQNLEEWWRESLVRERFLLAPGELDEWHSNVIELITEFFWRYTREFFPMKTNWCVAKYGRCPYFEVCTTQPPADRLLILNSGLYQENTWSPLKEPSQSKQN